MKSSPGAEAIPAEGVRRYTAAVSFARHRFLPSAAVLAFLVACHNEAPPPVPPPPMAASANAGPATTGAPASAPSDDAAFRRIADRFVAWYLEATPTEATRIGEHRYDGKWPDWSEAGQAKERQTLEGIRAELGGLAKDRLSVQERIDAAILDNRLAYRIFSLDELRSAVVNPAAWTEVLGDGLDPLVTREFAPLEERLASLRGRLLGIGAMVAVAKARLGTPSRIHTETAIKQNKGLVALMKGGLAEQLAKVSPESKKETEAAAKTAAAALEDFQRFLEKDLLPRSTGDFRIGKARFEKKLRFELDDDVDPDALARDARAVLAETQDAMAATALEAWPTLFPGAAPPKAETKEDRRALVKKALVRLAEDRPTNATILAEAKETLAQATRFVREHDLVRVPDEPCQVIEMPEYRRGVAVAYCDSSGPLEKKQETFYAIAPTPKDWSAKRAESFYREYNRSMLVDLTVHEAMPGHFLQAMHANAFHDTLRAIFSNGAFVEGWAVYAEWLLAKHGLGGPKVRLQRQKMLLRIACNAILDHDIHAGTMDEKAALALMTNEGFQEEGEAVGKWTRARVTSAQLSTYYYGFTELAKLRADAEKRPGFSERAYHDKLLSFGEPSFRHLRGLMGGLTRD
jgi:uncharacterized protein (DUF885 family)